ncbi:MAG: hypothetical protein V1798_11510 [Pseudomonadota bacterium]
MLPGFNHNIRHQGLLFHVQTEDAGDQNPYVITTLFFSGNVVASRRSSYEKFAKLKDKDEIVMAIMKDQHKEMLKDLVSDRLRSVQLLLGQAPGDRTPAAGAKRGSPSERGLKENPASRTLDADAAVNRSPDELIGEFLKREAPKKP